MKGLLTLQNRGSVVFDYGNNLRGEAAANGVKYPDITTELLEIATRNMADHCGDQ